MRKTIVLALCIFIASFNEIYAQTTSGDVIAVIGESHGTYVPDMITFNFTISITEKKQIEAYQKLKVESNEIIDRIAKLGIDTKEIKLTSYTLEESFDYSSDSPKKNGYDANESFEVEIKYNDTYFNQFIDSISNMKNMHLDFNYELSFSDSLKSVIQNELIAKATLNAAEIAKTLAKSCNVILGDIYTIEYTQNIDFMYGLGDLLPPPPPPSREIHAEMMSYAPEIKSRISMKGLDLSQQVRIVYKIKTNK